MTSNKWTWMPHAAHLIVADDCRFHLATELGNGIIVSTVGEYWPDNVVRKIHAQHHDPEWFGKHMPLRGDEWDAEYMKRFGFEEIGAGRTYETMVFRAKTARRNETGGCCKYVIDSGQDYDMEGYSDPSAAYNGHMAMCAKWAAKGINDLTE